MTFRRARLAALSLVAIATASASLGAQGSKPARAGPGLTRGLTIADSLITAGLGTLAPGAVLVVAKDGRILHERAFGHTRAVRGAIVAGGTHEVVYPDRPMQTSTVFDVASVTKVMATTMAAMILVDRGQLKLGAPVYHYLSDFRGPRLDSIRVQHLLQHSSGLVQWQPLYYQASNKAETYRSIRETPLGWGVGGGRHYSDLGFMLLGYIIEKVTGRPLDSFVDRELYNPLGLHHTAFNPKRRGITEFAPTEHGNGYEHRMVHDSTFAYKYRGDPKSWDKWRNYMLVGETNDGNSFYANGGVAGHAGLFSTASELSVLLHLLNSKGVVNGRRFIRPGVIEEFLSLDKYGHYLGWQQQEGLPRGSFMHTGFTGTYVLGVPKHGLAIVLLTNRQNLGTNAKGFFPDVGPLRIGVSNAIVAGAEADAGPSTTAAGVREARFETVDFQSGRWLKGNTHTHTLESDGDSPPELVTRWYKTHGYNFLVLSDHNVWVNPATLAHLVDSAFILIPGEELTSRFGSKPVHVNGLNIPRVVAPRTDSTLLGTVQKNVDAVREVEGVPHINHPNFGWAIPQEVLAKVRNDRLIEIYNGHPLVHNDGGGDSPGMEAVWDYVLTGGKRIYGIAVDDAHSFQGEFSPDRSNPGRGWVMVRANSLNARTIMSQMEAGRFYASTGVELDSVRVTPRDLTIHVRQRGNFKFVTEFIGRGGAVLKTTGENPAIYKLSGSETYVRAKVRNSGGGIGWVQPVFVER